MNQFSGDDFWPLVFFAVIVLFVGERMIRGFPTLKVWGLRISALAFVGFTIANAYSFHGVDAFGLLSSAVVGLIGALVLLGPAWILLSIVGFIFGFYRNAASSARSASRQRQTERTNRSAEKRKRQEQIEWERRAPEREKMQMEDANRRESENRQRRADERRRTNARAECEMLYQLYAVDISPRFPRESMDDWIKKYMADNQSPDEVDQRAEQLRGMIIHHRDQVKPPPKFTSLPELATWYQEQKDQIDALPIDDRVKRTLIANLNIRNAELMGVIVEGS